jgi:hypothetical protein
MRHHQTNNGGHYAVAPEASGLGVLVQIMEGWGTHAQAREVLTIDEAIHLSDLLLAAVAPHRKYGSGHGSLAGHIERE